MGVTTHGMHDTKIYVRWQSMIRRCESPKEIAYPNYGGRGISVCEFWHKFENFYADMGEPPFKGAQIDRIDNDGNYCKDNCRWVSSADNHLNRRNTRGKLKTGVFLNVKCVNTVRFLAYITVQGNKYYISSHDTEDEAHEAYCKMFLEWYGKDAKIYIDWRYL